MVPDGGACTKVPRLDEAQGCSFTCGVVFLLEAIAIDTPAVATTHHRISTAISRCQYPRWGPSLLPAWVPLHGFCAPCPDLPGMVVGASRSC